MGDTMRIRDTDTGDVYEGPAGEVPAGYELVKSDPNPGEIRNQGWDPVEWGNKLLFGKPSGETSGLDILAGLVSLGTGWAGSELGGGLVGGLTRLRWPLAGKAKDAGIVAGAVKGVEPLLESAPTASGIQTALRGGVGKNLVQGARQEGLDSIIAALQAAEQGPGYAGVPQASSRFTSLLAELADANQGAWNQGGMLRDSSGVLQKLRDRGEIVADIQRTLPPELYAKFSGLQDQYARMELLRTLLIGRGEKAPIGTNGINMAEIQRRVAENEARIRSVLGDEQAGQFIQQLYRGGQPPVGDYRLQIPIGKGIPLPFTYLRSKAVPDLMDFIGRSAGFAGGAYGGYQATQAAGNPYRR